jgi:fluoroacetyl-CoA thioesterase
MDKIMPGMVGEQTLLVTYDHSARHFGSGSIDVFATPAMIALMESAALAAIDAGLEAGTTSVGTFIEVRHLAASLIGAEITARAEVTGVEGREVQFSVQAWDEHELIGEGTHTRFIIDVARFMNRVESKR